jgi:hypothetical protein
VQRGLAQAAAVAAEADRALLGGSEVRRHR